MVEAGEWFFHAVLICNLLSLSIFAQTLLDDSSDIAARGIVISEVVDKAGLPLASMTLPALCTNVSLL